MRRDYAFIGGCALYLLLVFADAYLTIKGLGIGFEEGNPLVKYFMDVIGVLPALIGYCILIIFVVLLLIYINEKYGNKFLIKQLCLVVLILIIISRTYVVGRWIASIELIEMIGGVI